MIFFRRMNRVVARHREDRTGVFSYEEEEMDSQVETLFQAQEAQLSALTQRVADLERQIAEMREHIPNGGRRPDCDDSR